METKQTAVDYLLTQISARIDIIKPNAIEVALLQDVYYKAKAMEKEQIKEGFNAGIGLNGIIDDCDDIFEIFYEETYGK